ncbi:MAG: EAL domain-containing protein, partial [Desulfobacterales bacterium]|nr:EAL domain-containing protein [Desulfobacterales bacterium]
MAKEDKIKELKQIIREKCIRTHFQPIISLKTGEILGYEALSRGPEKSYYESPNQLFSDAKEFDMLFELEKLAREKALIKASRLDKQYKLFINVDPCVIFDKHFKGGFTRDLISKIELLQSNIVMELTEKTMINNFSTFKSALEHYKKQGFKLAIDDTGVGYSGLRSIVSVNFDYIKIDRSLIEDI